MSLKAFLAGNVEKPKAIKRVVSKRFKDENGKPIEWEFSPVGEERHLKIRKESKREVRIKKNIYKDQTDTDKYLLKLAVETITYPDLYNKELQDSYEVMGAESLLKAMLISGEYGKVLEIVQEVNQFDTEEDLIEEAKN